MYGETDVFAGVGSKEEQSRVRCFFLMKSNLLEILSTNVEGVC